MINNYNIIVIGGSAGSFPVVSSILGALPKDFSIPIVLCLHRLKHVRHGFVEALNIKSSIEVKEPDDKDPIKKGKIYLAPSNYHLFTELGNTFALSTEEMVNYSRPSIDLTYETASYVFKHKMIGIILSGANTDGAKGMLKVHQRKGFTIVQDPMEAQVKTMPESTLKLFTPDKILSEQGIIDVLKSIHILNKV